MAIKENATVKVIGGFYEGQTGKVARLYPELNTATITIDGVDRLVKIRMDALEEVDVKIEIPEGAKKISQADFDAALIQATTIAMSKNAPAIMGALSAAVVGEHIGAEIFKESDVVVMTEDEFIGALWDGCHPQRVSETVGNMMDTRRSMSVSIASAITLKTIPGILFGGENG